MESKSQVWVLVYKIKLMTNKKWVTCSEVFKAAELMVEKQYKLSRIYGAKSYKLIHYGCGNVEG